MPASLDSAASPTIVDVLLVDDRRDNLLALSALLESPGYRLVTATSATEALELLGRHDFAVILLDAVMPGMSGFEAVPRIRQHPRGAKVPIIFVTAADASPDTLRSAYEAGAVDYLVKPVEPVIVQAKVAVFAELARQKLHIMRQAALLQETEHRRADSTRAQLLEAEQRARAVAEAAERRWEFIAEASSQLAASLDYRTTLVSVARLAVPALCDWCIGYMIETDGKIRRLAVAHQDPENERVAIELRRSPLALTDPHPVVQAIRVGLSGILPFLSDDILRTMVPPGADFETIKGLGLRSMMIVPLCARGKVVGAISLSSCQVGRTYGEADLAVAEDLASHAALAIDNARLYHEANEAISARDEFLSIAAHELRTPLTALHLQVQSLAKHIKRGAKTDDDSRRTDTKVRTAGKQIERLTRLVDELLDVSRITSGKLRLEREELSLTLLTHDVITRMAAELDLARCVVAFRPEPDAVGRWDRMRIEQVLTNLLSNAAKYGPGQRIDVSIEVDGDRVRLSVHDRGIGISPALQERIFERFGRAVPQREYPGLGLGLYIARQIMVAHGGTIRVESHAGEGSTFTIELPRYPLEERAGSEPP
jgi:signal transduction histidine kinase/CheY-like chemotaxis protein